MSGTKLTELELEMRAAEEAHKKKKMAGLKKRAEAEERRIESKLLDVLRTEHSDLYEEVRTEAIEQLATERAERSSAAKRARGSKAADGESNHGEESTGSLRVA